MHQTKREEALSWYRRISEKAMLLEQHPLWPRAVVFMPDLLGDYEEIKRSALEGVTFLESGEYASDDHLDYVIESAKQFSEASGKLFERLESIESCKCYVPKKLYKYVVAERIDVLQNGHIRFTQHQDLNDPLDLAPFVEAIVGEGEMPKFVQGLEQLAEERAKSENAVSNATYILEKLCLQELEAQGKLELSDEERARMRVTIEQAFLMKPESAEAFNRLYGIIAQGAVSIGALAFPEVDKSVAQKIPQILNELVGILSLTERPDNPTMWAHYAGGHTGFVIEFDSANSFFHYPAKANASALKSVRYEKRQAIKSLVAKANNVEDLFFVKTPDWSYEQEWRLVRSLEDADLVVEEHIHLFAFPPDCITGVILGMKMEEHRRRTLVEFLQTDSRYTHVNVYEATLDAQTGYILAHSVI